MAKLERTQMEHKMECRNVYEKQWKRKRKNCGWHTCPENSKKKKTEWVAVQQRLKQHQATQKPANENDKNTSESAQHEERTHRSYSFKYILFFKKSC